MLIFGDLMPLILVFLYTVSLMKCSCQTNSLAEFIPGNFSTSSFKMKVTYLFFLISIIILRGLVPKPSLPALPYFGIEFMEETNPVVIYGYLWYINFLKVNEQVNVKGTVLLIR